jgi:hypothetical protein
VRVAAAMDRSLSALLRRARRELPRRDRLGAAAGLRSSGRAAAPGAAARPRRREVAASWRSSCAAPGDGRAEATQ